MSLTNQVVINNFAKDISDAINEVGGDTSSVTHLCDYARIIREQLLSANADVDYIAGQGINITKNGTKFVISANSDATLTDKLNNFDKGTTIQSVLGELFSDILPKLPSVLKGDVVVSDNNGHDQYQYPTDFPPVLYVKTGLNPNSIYMRLFLSSQKEPIYILMGDIFISEAPQDDKMYGRKNGKWEEIKEVNGSGKTIRPLSPPYPKDCDIPSGTPIQKVFEILFDSILPSMPSVLKGDVIYSTREGNDVYQHPKYEDTCVKSGLDPNTYYIRIFVNSQQEPIYISCTPLKLNCEGKTYKGSSGDGVNVAVNNDTNIISAILEYIPTNVMNNSKLYPSEIKNIFNEIFK